MLEIRENRSEIADPTLYLKKGCFLEGETFREHYNTQLSQPDTKFKSLEAGGSLTKDI